MAICSSPVSYDHIQGVMALSLFEDFVYWTDGKSKSLRRAHKTTGAQGIELLNSWQAIKSIKVYHSLRQPEGTKSIWQSPPLYPLMPSSCDGPPLLCRDGNGSCNEPRFVLLFLLYSTQTPVSDCERRMQPPVSSIPRRGT